MGITEYALKKNILIDPDRGVTYGYDTVYDSVPIKFETVAIPLVPTDMIYAMVQEMRIQNGITDPGGTMQVYTGLNGYTKSHVDSCIECFIDDPVSPDDNEFYYIDLDEREQKIVYDNLNEQLVAQTGKTAQEHLAEAARKLRDDND